MRTFGTLDYADVTTRSPGTWIIRAEPHVTVKLKRWFPRARPNAAGVLMLSDTPEIGSDLAWILSRWPLKAKRAHLALLEQRAGEYDEQRATLHRILTGGKALGGRDWLEPAFSPRSHDGKVWQSAPADVVLSTGRTLCGDVLGLGKQSPVDSVVITPAGPRRLGDLTVGDMVTSASGHPTRVTGVYPQGVRQNWRVTFADGRSLEAGAAHLWEVRTRKGVLQVLDTATMIARGVTQPGGLRRWRVRLPKPVRYAPRGPLPVDPYLLGAMLGNGSMTANVPQFYSQDGEHLQLLIPLLPAGLRVASYGDRGLHFAFVGDVGAAANPLKEGLTAAGVWGHKAAAKRVPTEYMLASVEDRLSVLSGLMDTDGCAESRVTASFSSVSEGLADDVVDLVRSLGGCARTETRTQGARGRGRKGDTIYRVRLNLSMQVFRLPRKAAKFTPRSKVDISIKSIEPTRMVESRCIAVDAPDHLYVAGEFVVTHNTFEGLLVLRDPAARPALVVCPPHLQRQWMRELAKFFPTLNGHVIRSTKVYDPSQVGGARGYTPDVLITSYSKLAAWVDYLVDAAQSGRLATVIFDEMHELRRRESLKYSAAERIAAAARFKMGLTGTIVFNYGGDVHTIIRVLDRDALGSREEFVREWGKDLGRGKVGVRDPRALGLHLRDQGLHIRRTRADVGEETPGVDRIAHEVDVDRKTMDRLMDGVLDLAELIVAGGDRRELFLARGEIDWKMRRATGLAKAPYVAAFVKLLLESQDKVVLWGWHRDVYELWMEKLDEFSPAMYTGSEGPRQKALSAARFIGGEQLQAFNDEDRRAGRIGKYASHAESRVLIMSLRSGAGVDGLQQGCSIGVFGELDWSPAQHDQCIGRLDRDGQEHRVLAYYLHTPDGSDPAVLEVLGVKRQQGELIRDPTLPMLEQANSTTDRPRRLAEEALRRRATKRAA